MMTKFLNNTIETKQDNSTEYLDKYDKCHDSKAENHR